ncbi:MAG: threonine-phosphate decarboxylase CobD [Beijerinckiaceae bacterium]
MQHGGDLTEAMARFGGGADGWLDLSTGINPHIWPLPEIAPRFWQALPAKRDLHALLDAARVAYGVPDAAAIVAAPGTQALIQWMPRLAPARGVTVLSPTYSEHAAAFREAGQSVREVTDTADWNGSDNLIVVNPNNPDGRMLTQAELRRLAERATAGGGWLIVDESFVDTMPDVSCVDLCAEYPVVILRSFGKFYGLAGVRLGFVIAGAEIARRFEIALGPWAVAGPALAIGRAALADVVCADDMRRRLVLEAAALDAVLVSGGLEIVGGTTLYRLVRSADATGLHDHLANHRIWTRRFDWDHTLLRFGLPGDAAGLERLAGALSSHARPQGVTAVSPPAS